MLNSFLQIRQTAFRYLVDNLCSKYTNYDCNKYRDIAFIPALDGSTNCLGTPHQIISKPEWSQLGFLVIDPTLQSEAVKLQIREHPTTAQLVEFLRTMRPDDPQVGKKWFTVLAIRVSGMYLFSSTKNIVDLLHSFIRLLTFRAFQAGGNLFCSCAHLVRKCRSYHALVTTYAVLSWSTLEGEVSLKTLRVCRLWDSGQCLSYCLWGQARTKR